MNLAFVLRRALFDCNLVRQNNTTSALITEAQLVSWAQDAVRELEALWRESKEDQNLTIRNSGDSSFTFEGETYAPSSFQLTNTGLTFTLPPDLVQIKRIRATTAAYRGTIFTHMDMSHPTFRALADTDAVKGGEVYYDVVARRTLRMSHGMPGTCEIEIAYTAKLPNLFVYSTGSVGVTKDDTAVTGASTEWAIERLSTPAVILLNSAGDATRPYITSQTSTDDFLDPSTRSGSLVGPWPVASFTDDTNLVLAATYTPATDATIGYLVCSAPWMLENHYPLVIRYLRHLIYDKTGNKAAAKEQFAYWMAGKKQFQYDVLGRAQDVEFVFDFDG